MAGLREKRSNLLSVMSSVLFFIKGQLNYAAKPEVTPPVIPQTHKNLTNGILSGYTDPSERGRCDFPLPLSIHSETSCVPGDLQNRVGLNPQSTGEISRE